MAKLMETSRKFYHQTVPGKPLLIIVCLVFPRATSHLFSTQSKGNFVGISNTDLTLWKQSKVIERGSGHCYLCLKSPAAEREVSLITLGSGCGCHGMFGLVISMKTLILRCESDILHPKNSLIGSITGLLESQPSKPAADPASGNSFHPVPRQLPARLEPGNNGKWDCPQLGWHSPWLNHRVTAGDKQQGPAQSRVTYQAHTHTWISGQSNQPEGSLCALTPVQSGNTTIPIPICPSGICKHFKCMTEIAQGAKSCPSVSELACD